MGNFIEICCMRDWIARRLQELRGPAKVIHFPLKDEYIYRLRNVIYTYIYIINNTYIASALYI